MKKLMFFMIVAVLAVVSIVAALPAQPVCNDIPQCWGDTPCGEGCSCTQPSTSKTLPPGTCEVNPPQQSEVPEFTTIGIGAAIVLGGAAYLMFKKKKAQ